MGGALQPTHGGIWSMPKPDVNGFCNDFYSARFMEGAANTCTRQISLASGSTDCETILNPQGWTELVTVLSGRAPGSNQIQVEINDYYTVDAVTGDYTLELIDLP